MGIWDNVKKYGGYALGGIPGAAISYATGGKSPLDWGKQTADPSKAKLEGGQYMRDYLTGRLGGVDGRAAPQAGRTTIGQVAQGQGAQIDTGPQGQFRAREMLLADQAARVASGQDKGAGELAVRRQMAQAAAQQQAMAASQRGANAGIAGRAAARGLGANSVDAAGMAGQAALQDQGAARNLLAGVLGQGRAADIGIAGQQAGLNQQMNLANLDAQNQKVFQQAGLDQATSLANMQARLQQQGMNDQMSLGLMAQLYGISLAEMQARLGQEAANMGQTGIFGDLLQVGGSLGAAAVTASDERLKTDVEIADADVDALLDAIAPKSFRYLDEKHGDGRITGVMAQDLERSDAGRGVVVETADGKMLDSRKTISLLLAAVARLGARVKQLEGAG